MPNIIDTYSRHAHYLEQYFNSVDGKIDKFLSKIARSLRLELTQTQTVFSAKRKKALLDFTEALMLEQLTGFTDVLSEQIDMFAESEADFAVKTITGSNNLIDMILPSPAQLHAAVYARPFNNRLLKDYLKEFTTTQARQVRDAVSMGFFEGKTTSQIIQEIIGTKSQNYKNGILNVTRTSASRMTRTALNHTAAVAKNKTFERNIDLIPYYEWVSTLDGRTSTICKALDSTVYKVGKGRLPPAHFNACVEGTLITTKRGLVPIEHVMVGDYALTHSGRYKRVTCVMAKENNTKVTELINDLGERVRLTNDHPVLTSDGWKNCGEVRKSDKIFNHFNKFIWSKYWVFKSLVEQQVLIDAHNIKTSTTEKLIPYKVTSFTAGVSSAINLNNNIISNNKIRNVFRDCWLKFKRNIELVK